MCRLGARNVRLAGGIADSVAGERLVSGRLRACVAEYRVVELIPGRGPQGPTDVEVAHRLGRRNGQCQMKDGGSRCPHDTPTQNRGAAARYRLLLEVVCCVRLRPWGCTRWLAALRRARQEWGAGAHLLVADRREGRNGMQVGSVAYLPEPRRSGVGLGHASGRARAAVSVASASTRRARRRRRPARPRRCDDLPRRRDRTARRHACRD